MGHTILECQIHMHPGVQVVVRSESGVRTYYSQDAAEDHGPSYLEELLENAAACLPISLCIKDDENKSNEDGAGGHVMVRFDLLLPA